MRSERGVLALGELMAWSGALRLWVGVQDERMGWHAPTKAMRRWLGALIR